MQPEDKMQPIRTIHIYYEEEMEPIIDNEPAGDREPEPEPGAENHRAAGAICAVFLVLLCVGMILLQFRLPTLYQNIYDTTMSRQITLTLSQQPAAGEVRLYPLAEITMREQTTVTASGSL